MNEEGFSIQIRKLLKNIGVTRQRKIETTNKYCALNVNKNAKEQIVQST